MGFGTILSQKCYGLCLQIPAYQLGNLKILWSIRKYGLSGVWVRRVLTVSWESIEIHVESKSSVRDMVRQSGTYSRCCLLSNTRHFFSLGIGFNFKKMESYVFVFHQGRLSSSRPLRVMTNEGFKGLVSHLVEILSFKDEAAYSLDTTRFHKFHRINNHHYKIERLLYMCGSLWGRSTVVYHLQGMCSRRL